MDKIRVSSEWADKERAVVCILFRYRAMVDEYKACLQQYAEMYPSTTSQIREVVSFGSGENCGESKMIGIIDHRMLFWNDLEQKRLRIRSIDNAVNSLPPDQCSIIRRYYFVRREMLDNDKYESGNDVMKRVCQETPMSSASFWRCKRKGIEALEKKLIVRDSETSFLT